MKHLIALLFISLVTIGCSSKPDTEKVLRVNGHLNAFGVENDHAPTIDVNVDFVTNKAAAQRAYYNPAVKASVYTLQAAEISKLKEIIEQADLSKLKQDYRITKTNQPASLITIVTDKKTYTIGDYGLEGEAPLPEIYKIIYKYEY
jgi:hypothetical protein